MLSPDVNVLIYAHRAETHSEHPSFARWLARLATGPEPFGLSVLTAVGFVRIVTNPRFLDPPTRLPVALAFVEALAERPTARWIGPGARHWSLVAELCRAASATGKLVADAQHAAVAIENGATWVTTDGDYARFTGLRWMHPLAS